MPRGLKSLARTLDRLSLALFVAVLFGLVAAILVLATPGWLLERGVVASGMPQFLPAAAPPLGETARSLAAIFAGLAIASSLWSIGAAIGAIVGRLGKRQAEDEAEASFIDSTQDENDDIAKRRPIFAGSDLGAPFMSEEAIAHARDELLLETLAPETGAEGGDTVAALLNRLENALARRESRTGVNAPIRPGSIASLRAALGPSVLYH